MEMRFSEFSPNTTLPGILILLRQNIMKPEFFYKKRLLYAVLAKHVCFICRINIGKKLSKKLT